MATRDEWLEALRKEWDAVERFDYLAHLDYAGLPQKDIDWARDEACRLGAEARRIEREYLGCPHQNREWQTVGYYYYSYGEVTDDIKEVLICTDCGKDLTLEEEDDGIPF